MNTEQKNASFNQFMVEKGVRAFKSKRTHTRNLHKQLVPSREWEFNQIKNFPCWNKILNYSKESKQKTTNKGWR